MRLREWHALSSKSCFDCFDDCCGGDDADGVDGAETAIGAG